MSPAAYITQLRIKEAEEMLQQTEKSITEVALECGFGSSSYFAKKFRATNQVSPRLYRLQKTEKDRSEE